MIDWVEDSTEPPALAWGYRWDGAATGADMLTAIVAVDARLFAKLGGSLSSPTAVYGVGYDANDDGQFALDDGTQFDEAGFAFTGPADLAESLDPDDHYGEGWFGGLWHHGIAAENPYNGGSWASGPGLASRTLADGAWDSWVFSPSFNFSAFAENPTAALPPTGPPGDYNGDGMVDADDYTEWKAAFGHIGHHAADGNGDGTVDAADYTVWRDHLKKGSGLFLEGRLVLACNSKNSPDPFFVPEPDGLLLSVFALFTSWYLCLHHRKESVS